MFGATTDKQSLSQIKPVVILVIGETSRAHNWQLNGYHRKTNPNLIQRDNLFYYNNAISAATHTSQTIQLVLSRATPKNLEPVYTEKSIITAFSEAGYKTVWISNQNMTGGVETSIYSIATEADVRIFSGADYRVKSEMDEILIPYDHDWDFPLTDDTLAALFKDIPESSFLTMICDSCHSGCELRYFTVGIIKSNI